MRPRRRRTLCSSNHPFGCFKPFCACCRRSPLALSFSSSSSTWSFSLSHSQTSDIISSHDSLLLTISSIGSTSVVLRTFPMLFFVFLLIDLTLWISLSTSFIASSLSAYNSCAGHISSVSLMKLGPDSHSSMLSAFTPSFVR